MDFAIEFHGSDRIEGFRASQFKPLPGSWGARAVAMVSIFVSYSNKTRRESQMHKQIFDKLNSRLPCQQIIPLIVIGKKTITLSRADISIRRIVIFFSFFLICFFRKLEESFHSCHGTFTCINHFCLHCGRRGEDHGLWKVADEARLDQGSTPCLDHLGRQKFQPRKVIHVLPVVASTQIHIS